ncbi:hypothetical protein XM38_010010 [Halomicronema hongdechloris C2206]|uniref:Phasin family protein n=1 Tax=Halomicronema hongdechloris C2206 TaxID=1641165 RepID=A0A1Z3HIE6_9CYAN|nr:hypothetical protein [Halomicronema hongdechloris]ASC70071.1 hypothetical protein XM38_010010 [Halomicronema hongdechloris C2206]
MAGFGDVVQKAFYLGVGLASYASEKAGSTLQELRTEAQKLADDLVARGEMTAEEAQRLINDMVQRAEQEAKATTESPSREPRRIEILDDEANDAATTGSTEEAEAEALRQQVAQLRQELEQLKRKSP